MNLHSQNLVDYTAGYLRFTWYVTMRGEKAETITEPPAKPAVTFAEDPQSDDMSVATDQ